MPPFIPFDTKYSPHTDISIHPATGVVSITVAFHPNNAGGWHCRVYELLPPYTGKPALKREWQQGQQGQQGPFGHGASVVLPNGALLVVAPLGVDSADNVTPTFMIEPGYAPPYALGTGGTDPNVVAAVNQLQTIAHEQQLRIDAQDRLSAMQAQTIAGIETQIGNAPPGGGLSVEQMADLYWLAQLRQLLRT